MAVNKNNERIYITFSKKQAEWLRRCAKKCNLQISDFVKWLIDKNVSRFFAKMNWEDQYISSTIIDDRNFEKGDGTDLKRRDEISQKEWDNLFKGRDEEPSKEDDDEIPF